MGFFNLDIEGTGDIKIGETSLAFNEWSKSRKCFVVRVFLLVEKYTKLVVKFINVFNEDDRISK